MAYQGFDNLFNQPTHKIIIYSFSTDSIFYFPAMLTNFSDSYKSNWNKTSVLGRMDPIATFKDTTRTISLAFDSPAYNELEAAIRMRDLQRLTQGLYPVYQDINVSQKGTSVLSSPPMFRIKFANLIQNATKDIDFQGDYSDGLAGGLLGYLDGFDYKPELDVGVFIINKYIVPKLVRVSLNFNVLHEHALGSRVKDNDVEVKIGSFPRLAQEALSKQLYPNAPTKPVDNQGQTEGQTEQVAADATVNGIPAGATNRTQEGAPATEPQAIAGREGGAPIAAQPATPLQGFTRQTLSGPKAGAGVTVSGPNPLAGARDSSKPGQRSP